MTTTRLLPRLLLACLAALALAPRQDAPPAPGASVLEAVEPVVVFLVRHAEKGTDDPQDPTLAEAGTQRADELARVLGNAGVTHLFSTEYQRTQGTLAPLAAAIGVDVEIVGARSFDRQVERLLALEPGSVAVVAGHSNTVPALVRSLARATDSSSGRDLTANLLEGEYDALFQVILPPAGRRTGEGAWSPTIVELRYGASRE